MGGLTLMTIFLRTDNCLTRHGKINFVDLAGSEMTKKTKSEGKTLEEANNINKSLMVISQRKQFSLNF